MGSRSDGVRMKYVALAGEECSDSEWQHRFRSLSKATDGQLSRGIGLAIEAGDQPDGDAVKAAMMAWTAGSARIEQCSLADISSSATTWASLTPVREHVLMGPPEYDDTALLRLAFLTRLDGLSASQFGRHWLDSHAPLVLASGPLFERYVVNLTEDEHAGWDGFVEQQFADEAARIEHDRQVLEDKPAVLADVRRFVGSARQFTVRVVAEWCAQ
jgi:hypothetical protein